MLESHQAQCAPAPTSTQEITFEFAVQTVPNGWYESYEYSWNLTQPTGYGIVPIKEGDR